MPMAGEAALSLKDGAGRVNRAPAIVASLWLASAAIALPLVLTVRTTIADHLGGSLEAGAAADGVNYDWMQEFSGRASGAATTFTPAVIGFAAVLDNLSAWADNVPRPPLITAAGLTYLVLLTFLAGGIIDRYARDRATREHGFFAACGVHFLRFVRLGAFSGVVYLAIFLWVHPWLFDTVFQRLTQDTTVERTAFLIRLGLYGVFALLLAAFQLLFDYARVRTVVEDRHSMVSAVLAAIRFLSRHGLRGVDPAKLAIR